MEEIEDIIYDELRKNIAVTGRFADEFVFMHVNRETKFSVDEQTNEIKTIVQNKLWREFNEERI